MSKDLKRWYRCFQYLCVSRLRRGSAAAERDSGEAVAAGPASTRLRTRELVCGCGVRAGARDGGVGPHGSERHTGLCSLASGRPIARGMRRGTQASGRQRRAPRRSCALHRRAPRSLPAGTPQRPRRAPRPCGRRCRAAAVAGAGTRGARAARTRRQARRSRAPWRTGMCRWESPAAGRAACSAPRRRRQSRHGRVCSPACAASPPGRQHSTKSRGCAGAAHTRRRALSPRVPSAAAVEATSTERLAKRGTGSGGP